ncbi:MAG: substrate-binding domain-containing protein [Verrucomicrobia bacterium]|nr:substrate-binding domain-containing protein [Verrucomicrobiota bacterium]
MLDNPTHKEQVLSMGSVTQFSPIWSQVAEHVRRELAYGRWSGVMPGSDRLARELGVNRKTAQSALAELERAGMLVSQGAGRRRRIVTAIQADAVRPLRVAILVTDDPGADYLIEMRHLLTEAGHVPFQPDKTLVDLGMDAGRVARFVTRTEADAWVIVSGSREILEGFSRQPKPAFALFGRREGLPIAAVGPDKAAAFVAVTRRLIGLGHRRISLLCRGQRRLPQPGLPERAFLDELAAHGIKSGTYNLPDWQESKEGFRTLLDSLFGVTPPTALILDEPFLFNAAFHYLAKQGLRVPQDISLVCTDDAPDFAWCEPSVAHIRWDYRPVVRRIVRWAANVSRGRPDLRQTLTKAEFVPGGTIGPVRGG